MKTYFLFFTITLTCCQWSVFGKIRNGYEKDLQQCQEALLVLQTSLLDNTLSNDVIRKLKSRIKANHEHIIGYYITDELLRRIQLVSPALYNEIDTIKDKQGRYIDVYVKFFPKDTSSEDLDGATIFQQSPSDVDRPISSYGLGTVSVRIMLTNTSLQILSHEFGHVKHIVPHLATFIKENGRFYPGYPPFRGHHKNDASGSIADACEVQYRKDYAEYIRNHGTRFNSPLELVKLYKYADDVINTIEKPLVFLNTENENVPLSSADSARKSR